jgi:hypothetical protein
MADHRIVLVRDQSDLSQRASALLDQLGEPYCVVYAKGDDELPYVEDQVRNEVYLGFAGVEQFVRSEVAIRSISGSSNP